MGKQWRGNAPREAAAASVGARAASGGARAASGGAQAAGDAVSLVLRQRAGGSAWAFAERAEGTPPLAQPSGLHRALSTAARAADRSRYWWFVTDSAVGDVGRQLRERVRAAARQRRPSRA